MSIRITVPWDDRFKPPKCNNVEMQKVDFEAQPIADQVKVTWRCDHCQTVVEAFANIYTEEVPARKRS